MASSSATNSIARQSRNPPRNGERSHQRNGERSEEARRPQYDGPRTFNFDGVVTTTNPKLEQTMFRIAKEMIPNGEERSCFKITNIGDGVLRVRAYSTRSKEEAHRRLEDFMSRCVYLTDKPVEMEIVNDEMYDTVKAFVVQGRKDKNNATLFANRIGNYTVSMDLDGSVVSIAAWVPLRNVSVEAEMKMKQTCVALLETLRDLDGTADFAAIMRRLDPEIMKIEAHKAAEYQAKQEQTRREQEKKARIEMQQAAAERIAARSAAQTASATNQFALLHVDEEEEEEEAKPKQATWATKVAEAPTQQRVQEQRGERVQEQRVRVQEQRGEQRGERVQGQRVRVQEQRGERVQEQRVPRACRYDVKCFDEAGGYDHPPNRVEVRAKQVRGERVQGQRGERVQERMHERRPMEETDCRYGSKCYNKSNGKCSFRHPVDDVERVQRVERVERVQEQVVIAVPQRVVVDEVFNADAAWGDEETSVKQAVVDDWEMMFPAL